jgi:hypothetical protein
MVSLRGGLSSLADNRELLIKLWSEPNANGTSCGADFDGRLDIAFALEDGSTAAFYSHLIAHRAIFRDFTQQL